MYFPKTPDECFMTQGSNFYNGELAKRQKERIEKNGLKGTYVELSYDGEKLVHKVSELKPVSTFPHKPGQVYNAPIVIYEFPIKEPPFGLYVAGIDPYRHAKSLNSDSLGAVYIFKRMHDISGENYQDMFVASYVARTKTKEEWNENARNLIKFYNARALCENDEMGFIDYMIAKGDSLYLEKQPAWLKEIAPTSTVRREYGLHSSPRIKEHLRSCLKMYMEETIRDAERDSKGSVIRPQVMGVNRILDPMLLEEVAQWNEDGNFDREIAASLAIALARHLDPIIGKIASEDNKKMKSYASVKTGSGLFKNYTYKPSIRRLFH
jgi:hypothetical protein